MEDLPKRKVQEMTKGQRMITIPRDLARIMDLDQGTEMKVKQIDNETLKLIKS